MHAIGCRTRGSVEATTVNFETATSDSQRESASAPSGRGPFITIPANNRLYKGRQFPHSIRRSVAIEVGVAQFNVLNLELAKIVTNNTSEELVEGVALALLLCFLCTHR